jgi:nitroreductase
MLDKPDVDIRNSTLVSSPGREGTCAPLLDLLMRRRSASPLRIGEPGPSPDEIKRLFTVATRVPDHGMLQPWRIILVQGTSRDKLGGLLAAAFLKSEQDGANSDVAIRKIRAVLTAPLVVIVVSQVDTSSRIPEWEQILSAGAVCMNLITAASVLGYGSTWLTGWAAYDPAALQVLGVQAGERVAGIIPIGTASEPQQERARPSLQKLLTVWTGA